MRTPAPGKPDAFEHLLIKAETVFVGRVINRTVDGDWVRAELVVEDALWNAQPRERVPVVWRSKLSRVERFSNTVDTDAGMSLGDQAAALYDAQEGDRALAILSYKETAVYPSLGLYKLSKSRYVFLDKLKKAKDVLKYKDPAYFDGSVGPLFAAAVKKGNKSVIEKYIQIFLAHQSGKDSYKKILVLEEWLSGLDCVKSADSDSMSIETYPPKTHIIVEFDTDIPALQKTNVCVSYDDGSGWVQLDSLHQ